MGVLDLACVNIQFDDFDFTEEELKQEKMLDLILEKYSKKVNNMIQEKFTVKIGWFKISQ